MEPNNEAGLVLAAVAAAENIARPVLISGVPHAVVPEGYDLRNLEYVLEEPKRARGEFAVSTAEAFNRTARLIRGQQDCETMPIFFNRSGVSASVKAVLNFSTWRDLLVDLRLNLSQPFLEWFRINGQQIGQRAFALFLEERTAHVVNPDGSALLGLARKFKANVQVRYQSMVEQENGDASLEYIQTTEAGAASAKSRMKVPNMITLGLPVWHGGDPVRFAARFGYQIGDDGKLSLSIEILQLEQLLTDELRKIVEKIGKEHQHSVVIEGANCAVAGLRQ